MTDLSMEAVRTAAAETIAREAGTCFEDALTAVDRAIAAHDRAVRAGVTTAMWDALSRHPKACDQYDPDDVISCGWKIAVADLEYTLNRIEGNAG